MTTTIRTMWAVVAVGLFSTVAAAQTPGEASAVAEKKWHVDVEWVAGLAAFGGVGAYAGVKPSWSRQVRFHAGVLALRLPEMGLGENAGQGWAVYDRAALAGGQYYFREKRGGFYAGLDALYQQRFFTREGVEGEGQVHQYILAAVAGYEWFPFDSLGLYVTPNFTFAYRLGETGTPGVGGAAFVEKAYLPLPGVNAGWEF